MVCTTSIYLDPRRACDAVNTISTNTMVQVMSSTYLNIIITVIYTHLILTCASTAPIHTYASYINSYFSYHFSSYSFSTMHVPTWYLPGVLGTNICIIYHFIIFISFHAWQFDSHFYILFTYFYAWHFESYFHMNLRMAFQFPFFTSLIHISF